MKKEFFILIMAQICFVFIRVKFAETEIIVMSETQTLLFFTDGSVNTKTNVGWGAFLAVSDIEVPLEIVTNKVKLKRFEETSSSKLEIQTILWALSEIQDFSGKIILYTDSQTILGLPGRRVRLEKNNYFSKQQRQISNWELYQQFYKITDELDCEFVKIKGHKKTILKDDIDRLFTLVDKASRSAVREENNSNNYNKF